MKRPATTLVIARYEEDLEWITAVPDHFRVVVYNKGRLIPSLSALKRADSVIPRDNQGREAETYLHHLREHRSDPAEWTVFSQGDPFTHSPDFLDLLKVQDQWSDIQSLTCQFYESLQTPPAYLLERETAGHLGGLRVRPETFSLYLWTACRFADRGSLDHRDRYARIHGMPAGANMAAHFLRVAGLPELAARAEAADCGRFAYGAIFAARSRLTSSLSMESLDTLHRLSKQDDFTAYLLERLWLHLFGLPFLTLRPEGSPLG
jgi:hypothetical protein